MATDWRPDFEQAMGETFGGFVSPPVPFEDASPHECCEVVWQVVGNDVTPDLLAALDDAKVAELAKSFGEHLSVSHQLLKNSETLSHTHWRVGLLALWMIQRHSPLHRRPTWFLRSGLRHTFALWQRALALVQSLAVRTSLASFRAVS